MIGVEGGIGSDGSLSQFSRGINHVGRRRVGRFETFSLRKRQE